MKTILAAVDFSDISDTVVAQASALAKAMGGRVLALAVVEPPVVSSEYAPFVENLAEIAAAAEKAAAARLAKVQERLASEQVAVDTCQRSGAPVPHILKEAREQKADYIVVGSHGHTAFYDLLVGSTTHGVLLRAPCPVVIVPPRKGRTTA